MGATMAKPKDRGDGAAEPSEKKRVSLMVNPEAGALVYKIAAMRGNISAAELFDHQDFQDFFRHVLLAEMDKEGARLRPPPPKR